MPFGVINVFEVSVAYKTLGRLNMFYCRRGEARSILEQLIHCICRR